MTNANFMMHALFSSFLTENDLRYKKNGEKNTAIMKQTAKNIVVG